MASTKLKVEDMEQIVNTLPKEDNQRVKTTLENFIDKGIEIGEERGIEIGKEIGKKSGKELQKIELILDALTDNQDIALIAKFVKVSIKTIKSIKKCHKDNFKNKALRKELAVELLSTFHNLKEDDIAKFCFLNIEEVEVLKAELLSED